MKIIRTGVVCKKYDINSAWTNVSFKLFGNSVTIFKAILFDFFIILYKKNDPEILVTNCILGFSTEHDNKMSIVKLPSNFFILSLYNV